MRLRRTTAHEIDFTLPRISGDYLNVVVPTLSHCVFFMYAQISMCICKLMSFFGVFQQPALIYQAKS